MKTGVKKRIDYLISIFCACFFILNSCGLETFYFLEPPVTDGHETSYDSTDPLQAYFSFMTTEKGENSKYIGGESEFIFLGTEVYYRIYNNYSTMESRQKTIDTYNTSSTYSVSYAAEQLEKYGYKTLKLKEGYFSPLIKTGATAQNRYVYIRLNDYGTDLNTKSVICISESKMQAYDPENTDIKLELIPLRNVDNHDYGFNFNSSDEDNPVPARDDDDVEFSSTSSEDRKWYVDMYAFSIGRDSQYSDSYSHVLHLGSITISESDYDD